MVDARIAEVRETLALLVLRGLGLWSDAGCSTLNTVQNAEWGKTVCRLCKQRVLRSDGSN